MASKKPLFGVSLLNFACCITLVCLGGCQNSVDEQDSEAAEKGLPKLTFHKPKDFSTAVKRLQEIHESIKSDDALPAPKTFSVIEIIHGTGPGGHSHYHLAHEYSPDQDDSHEHAHDHDDESKKTHEIEVDVMTEFLDIVRWLPKIAGDGDMGKDAWEQVRTESGQLNADLEKQIDDSMASDAKREVVRKLDSQLSKFLVDMAALAKATDSGDAENESTVDQRP